MSRANPTRLNPAAWQKGTSSAISLTSSIQGQGTSPQHRRRNAAAMPAPRYRGASTIRTTEAKVRLIHRARRRVSLPLRPNRRFRTELLSGPNPNTQMPIGSASCHSRYARLTGPRPFPR